MSLKDGVLLIGAGSCILPVLASYLRHRSGFAWGATVFASLSLASFLLILRRVFAVGPGLAVEPWLYGLVASGVPLVLSGYWLSATLGGRTRASPFARYGGPSSVCPWRGRRS